MKLRQKIALGLCVFYLVSVIGFALNLHFCGGELSAVHFSETAVACAGCKTVEKKDETNKCCKNTSIDAKIKDSHQSGSKVDLPKNYSIQWFLAPFLSKVFNSVFPKLFSRIENKAPPSVAGIAICIFNCVFRN